MNGDCTAERMPCRENTANMNVRQREYNQYDCAAERMQLMLISMSAS